jgi:four helix bundle protein
MAEGCGRGSDADFARFLWMANGSACEVDYLLLLGRDLRLLTVECYQELAGRLDEVKRMLASLIATVKPS